MPKQSKLDYDKARPFYLKRGKHVQKKRDAQGVLIVDEDGNHTLETFQANARERRFPIVHSFINLVAKFGNEKFAYADKQQSFVAQEEYINPLAEGLEAYTNKELIKYAEDEEIDLGSARTKREMVAIIRQELEKRE